MTETTNLGTGKDTSSLVDITGWPEWAAYVKNPCSQTLQALDRRAQAVGATDPLFAAMMQEYAASQQWKIAQHLSILYSLRDCWVESYYFARQALEGGKGNVHARVALATAAEKYGLIEHAVAELELARKQVRSIRDRRTRKAYRRAIAESHVRTSLGLDRVHEAAQWNRYLRAVNDPLADRFAVSIVEARCGVACTEIVMAEHHHLGKVDLLKYINHTELPLVRCFLLTVLREKVRLG